MVMFRNFILGIAIFILTLFVGIYGINTFYGKAPQYQDYCPQLSTQSDCVKAGGKWINNTYPASVMNGKTVPVEGGYCEYSYVDCEKRFNNAEKPYYKTLFTIAIPLGIVIIALGLLIFHLEAVGLGLMSGGVALIIYGAGQYWRFADDVIKFVLSFIGLVAVILLAYYFNKRFKWNLFGKKTENAKEKL